ncbi:hypothetical protein MRB53_017887 [Persea americana]|uniref:Uncharacterized protein n=1 Tax=Persea americana TaxID=3435 RepID=A0ACC2M729_PERAE|nr:hypothetical protein MRB53_017887 [Persea americana]
MGREKKACFFCNRPEQGRILAGILERDIQVHNYHLIASAVWHLIGYDVLLREECHLPRDPDCNLASSFGGFSEAWLLQSGVLHLFAADYSGHIASLTLRKIKNKNLCLSRTESIGGTIWCSACSILYM